MAVMLERWNDDKMDALDGKVGRIEVGLAKTSAKLDGLDGRVGRLEESVAKVDDRLDRLNGRLLAVLVAVIGAGATIAAAVLAAPHL
jgi:hypothetical protein